MQCQRQTCRKCAYILPTPDEQHELHACSHLRDRAYIPYTLIFVELLHGKWKCNISMIIFLYHLLLVGRSSMELQIIVLEKCKNPIIGFVKTVEHVIYFQIGAPIDL